MSSDQNFSVVGKSIPRPDARGKAVGAAQYADDIFLPGMLHGKLLRSPVAHARIKSIDTSAAEALPGVKCVITGQDIPKIKYGNWRLVPESQDEYALAIDTVRFIGDEVAAVAALDKGTAEDAIRLIKVEYEELPGAYSVEESLADGAPVIHDEYKQATPNISLDRKIDYGNLDEAFAEADLILDDVFTVHATSHAYMEPCSCISEYDHDGRLTIWTSTQAPYFVQCLLASTMEMRENDIRVIKPTVGGGFGGKMEMRPWEFCSAFIARKLGRPVKFTLTREEEFTAGRRRHPMRIHSKIGFSKDGMILGKEFIVHLDGGAYNSMG
ncbi:MAG: molybdopterin-dependent oxidoreductase, partial [Deltaproteobacteria bacterium]|nr:molybdopterin-dependent oxidoreductase [Deltaproteobacteria bacterium]